MFAIVDVSSRATRGKILLLVDDQASANEIAEEMNRRTVEVSVQWISTQLVDQLQADVRAGTPPPRARALA